MEAEGSRILLPIAGAMAALLAFALLFLLVAPRGPLGWEMDVVDVAIDLPGPVGGPLRLVMQLGRRSLVPAVGLGVYLVSRRAKPAVATVAAGLATASSIDVLKEWASRPRPTGVHWREAADGFGFPSGHAANAWAMAVVIAIQLPARWRWVPFLVALTVAVGRVHVGVHYPLDVVGGGLWGLTVGGVVVAATGLGPRRHDDRPSESAELG